MRVDGHDFTELHDAFSQIPFRTGKPSVVIADTERGRGQPSIENRADRWLCNFTSAEIAALIEELHGLDGAELESEALMVR